MVFSIKRSLAGPGYVILNVIRVMNIISLMAVFGASIVMIVKTIASSAFFFFDSLSHVFTAFLSVLLILSELSLFRGYFSRNWPLLSPSSGFVTLGLMMLILGVLILGHLNKEATSAKAIGLNFWQVIIAAGIVAFVMGVLNILASYLFRTKSLGVTARMVRAYGATAPQRVGDVVYQPKGSPSTSAFTPSVRSASQRTGTPRRSFSLPSDTLPSYHHPSEMRRADTTSSNGSRGGLNISAPTTNDHEQFSKFKGSDEIARPESAAHPAYQGGRF